MLNALQIFVAVVAVAYLLAAGYVIGDLLDAAENHDSCAAVADGHNFIQPACMLALVCLVVLL